MKRELQKQGLRSKYAAKSQVARWMGTAMAAGLEQHNYNRVGGDLVTEHVPYWYAMQSWNSEVEKFLAAGGVITDETYATRLLPLLERGLAHYAANDIIPAHWQIHSVERKFELGGNARPDVIVIDDEGYAPVDYKMKETLYIKPGETRDAARARTLAEFNNDWQLHHYVWCVRRFLGQPCDHYYIVLGELSPRPRFTIQRFDVSERAYQQWVDAAHGWWSDMYATECDMINLPRMAPTHESKYGPCEFQYACLEANLDPQKYQHKYITVERSK